MPRAVAGLGAWRPRRRRARWTEKILGSRAKRAQPPGEQVPHAPEAESAPDSTHPEARPGAKEATPQATAGMWKEYTSQYERGQAILEMRARLLWSSDYSVLLEVEKLEVPDLWQAVSDQHHEKLSSWRARLTGDKLLAYEAKTERMILRSVARLRRRRNQLDIPFSTLATSVSHFNQRVPTRVWREAQKDFSLLHRDVCERYVKAMVAVEPASPFPLSQSMSVFCADQCNHWQAAKKGREFRGAERLDASGMPVTIRSETVLNVVQRRIPFNLPLLTDAEVALIKQHGPYTEPATNLYNILAPSRVQRDVWEWVSQLMRRVYPMDTREERDAPLPAWTERDIVDKVLGKPTIKPRGPSEMDIHPSIQKCDTKSFADLIKMWDHLVRWSPAGVIAIFVFCDGQLVELLRAGKRRWRSQFKKAVICNGFFHAFIHLCFCLNTGYWLVSAICLACVCMCVWHVHVFVTTCDAHMLSMMLCSPHSVAVACLQNGSTKRKRSTSS